jgi:hypothetical protein
VVIRRTRVVEVLGDGTRVVRPRYDLFAVQHPQPRYYLNGQPVYAYASRWWPRARTSYRLGRGYGYR